jgi:hypothetical protein
MPQLSLVPKSVAPEVKGKMGLIRRSSGTAAIAMALFLYWSRDRLAVSIDKLLEITNTKKASSLYVALNNMVTSGYIKRTGYGIYCWGDKFAYPFSAAVEGDVAMVKQLPPSMRGEVPRTTGLPREPELVKTAAATETTVAPESTTVAELDFLIANLQSSVRSIGEQIELLRKIRDRKLEAA